MSEDDIEKIKHELAVLHGAVCFAPMAARSGTIETYVDETLKIIKGIEEIVYGEEQNND